MIPASTDVDYAVGGSVTFTVKVVEDVVDADATVYIYKGGQAITSYTKAYDGATITTSDFDVKLYGADGNPLTDDDATLVLCDSEGNPLSSGIKDAGSYILKVVSTNYELTGTTEIPVTITKVDLSELKLFSLKEWGGAEYLPQKLDSSAKPQDYKWDEIDVRYNTGVADDDETDAATDGKAWESLKADRRLQRPRQVPHPREVGRRGGRVGEAVHLGRQVQGGGPLPHHRLRHQGPGEELHLRERRQHHLRRVPRREPEQARLHRRRSRQLVLRVGLHRPVLQDHERLRRHEGLRPREPHHPRPGRRRALQHGGRLRRDQPERDRGQARRRDQPRLQRAFRLRHRLLRRGRQGLLRQGPSPGPSRPAS